jgi:Na+-translocating ferredoxin:NAD+ oxidoreductase RnfD subunit
MYGSAVVVMMNPAMIAAVVVRMTHRSRTVVTSWRGRRMTAPRVSRAGQMMLQL